MDNDFTADIDIETGEVLNTPENTKYGFKMEELKINESENILKFLVKNKRIHKIYDSYEVVFTLDENYFDSEFERLNKKRYDIEHNPTLLKKEDEKLLKEIDEEHAQILSRLKDKRLKYPKISFVLMTKKFEYVISGSRIFFDVKNEDNLIEIIKRGIGVFGRECECYLIPIILK